MPTIRRFLNTQDLELADTNNFTLSFQPTDESQIETTGTIVFQLKPHADGRQRSGRLGRANGRWG